MVKDIWDNCHATRWMGGLLLWCALGTTASANSQVELTGTLPTVIDGTSEQIYLLDGQSGDEWQFTLESSEFDALLRLITPTGETVVINDDARVADLLEPTDLVATQWQAFRSEMTVVLPTSGQYQLEVATFSGLGGDYTLSAMQNSERVDSQINDSQMGNENSLLLVPVPTPDENNNGLQSSSLPLEPDFSEDSMENASDQGTLHYSFWGEAGQAIILATRWPGAQPTYEIQSLLGGHIVEGEYLTFISDPNEAGYSHQIYLLPEEGDYQLTISHRNRPPGDAYLTQQAMSDYAALRLRRATTVERLMHKAQQLLQQEAYEVEIATFSEAIELAPENPELYRARALWYGMIAMRDGFISDTGSLDLFFSDMYAYYQTLEPETQEQIIRDLRDAAELYEQSPHFDNPRFVNPDHPEFLREISHWLDTGEPTPSLIETLNNAQ